MEIQNGGSSWKLSITKETTHIPTTDAFSFPSFFHPTLSGDTFPEDHLAEKVPEGMHSDSLKRRVSPLLTQNLTRKNASGGPLS